MSMLEPEDIAIWEAKRKMSCKYCEHYNGDMTECEFGVVVTNGVESLYCDAYLYNGEVKSE